MGSSPLARGLRIEGAKTAGTAGIIPARAGFTVPMMAWVAATPDHPRSRGVYLLQATIMGLRSGSSPLARGLPKSWGDQAFGERIIPARAGFTLEDPWNPNDESPYQTAFTFTADLALAPQSSDSAAVAQRSTRTPSEA